MLDEPIQQSRANRRPLALGFAVLASLGSPDWWRFLFTFIRTFRARLLKPSIMLGIGLTLPTVGYDLAVQPLIKHGTFYGLADVLSTIGVSIAAILVCSVGSIVLVAWGLLSTLFALTAMCRSFLSSDPCNRNSAHSGLEPSLFLQLQTDAAAYFQHKKAFVITVWLFYSLYMLLPSAVLVASFVAVFTGLPSELIGPCHVEYPPVLWIPLSSTIGIALLIMSNYALVLLPYSSFSTLKPAAVALHALLLSFKIWPALTLYSAVFFVASSILTSPVDLLVISNPALVTQTASRYLLLLVKAMLHILFFLLFVPFSLLIPCEMVRDNID